MNHVGGLLHSELRPPIQQVHPSADLHRLPNPWYLGLVPTEHQKPTWFPWADYHQATPTNLFMHRERGNFNPLLNMHSPRMPKLEPSKGLLALPVRIEHKARVAHLLQLFQREGFFIVLFQQDESDWSDVPGYGTSIASIRAHRRSKWWFAKHFLVPDLVENYAYLFLWDPDVVLPDAWSPRSAVELLKAYGVHAGFPAFASGVPSEDPMLNRLFSLDDARLHANEIGRFTSLFHPKYPIVASSTWRSCVWESLPDDPADIEVGMEWYLYPFCASQGHCRFVILDQVYVHHRPEAPDDDTDSDLSGLAESIRTTRNNEHRPSLSAREHSDTPTTESVRTSAGSLSRSYYTAWVAEQCAPTPLAHLRHIAAWESGLESLLTQHWQNVSHPGVSPKDLTQLPVYSLTSVSRQALNRVQLFCNYADHLSTTTHRPFNAPVQHMHSVRGPIRCPDSTYFGTVHSYILP